MTLDKMELEAKAWLSAKETPHLNFLCTRLARALLAVLPVVRAAEEWRDADYEMEHGTDPAAGDRFRQAWDNLNDAVDARRRAMEQR